MLQRQLGSPAVNRSKAAGCTAFQTGRVQYRAFQQRASRQTCTTVCQAAAADAAAPVKGDLLNVSYYPSRADAANVSKGWYIIDAKGQTLGRLATLAATYIRGKHLSTYTPSMDMGAYVVVINADQVTVTGNKPDDKLYFRHVNGRPGSWKSETFNQLQRRLPERIIEHAVKGMLPKGRLGRKIRLHLKVYKGEQHPHVAQQPVDITADIVSKRRSIPIQK